MYDELNKIYEKIYNKIVKEKFRDEKHNYFDVVISNCDNNLEYCFVELFLYFSIFKNDLLKELPSILERKDIDDKIKIELIKFDLKLLKDIYDSFDNNEILKENDDGTKIKDYFEWLEDKNGD